ncbi:uncharacterized protein LOC111707361 [Eurytemora carolleeae]|uniref:uncharacterized protein LOC111707361 n=1 Tax=Eurytemora carolleeae TaxID=1294199 RepID=UPI000C757A99|nr:uncharacterized protein LOC111707361 [Eurytemora carolleeae]|eukprot:XP_023336225.1 uncharacterized protein LOC111707361 [Eurytemora affinis]
MGSTDQLKPDPILPDPLDLEPDHLNPDPSPDLETHLWTAELNPDIDVDHFHADIRHDINPDLPAPIHPRFRYEHIYNYTSDPGEGSGFPDPYLESGYLDPEADLTLIHPDEIDNKFYGHHHPYNDAPGNKMYNLMHSDTIIVIISLILMILLGLIFRYHSSSLCIL